MNKYKFHLRSGMTSSIFLKNNSLVDPQFKNNWSVSPQYCYFIYLFVSKSCRNVKWWADDLASFKWDCSDSPDGAQTWSSSHTGEQNAACRSCQFIILLNTIFYVKIKKRMTIWRAKIIFFLTKLFSFGGGVWCQKAMFTLLITLSMVQ